MKLTERIQLAFLAHAWSWRQQAILALLKTVVAQALADRVFLPGIAATGLFSPKVESTWCEYLYQPFSAPRTFDHNDLLDAARARLALVGDHLHRLQTDTVYLERTICQVAVGSGFP